MEQPFSTSKVTVEYHDPYDVYKLIAPGLVPRLPLRHLHWQSHAGPLRSIDTLHIELTSSEADPSLTIGSPTPTPATLARPDSTQPSQSKDKDDGQTSAPAGRESESSAAPQPAGSQRRHQIPGLRRTPYLKVLLVRCDDNDSYKSTVRSEVREWIKKNSPPAQSTKKGSTAEHHDAFEWMILHVVIPNTTAATQPRTSGRSADGSMPDLSKTSSRWGKSSTTLLEKLRADFNGSSKSTVERVAQIRIGINDVPYDLLPRVVPAVPTGYTETPKDTEVAWDELIDKLKSLILTSFDLRVSQYEEDIKERDSQRSLPGWNFCTFFILKEGLAQGFESVGLVEDALVGYDELSVGLDTILHEQAVAGSPEAHGGALLKYTEDLKSLAQSALSSLSRGTDGENDDEPAETDTAPGESFEHIPISSSKKPYRDLILANNVSVFDFRCYIFARQIALLLRLANAWSTREELLAKLKEQQESVLHGVAPRAPPPKHTDESENLSMLAEICRRTLEFIPAVSLVMRSDIISAFAKKTAPDDDSAGPRIMLDAALSEVVDNMVASYAFSIAQQILAQTSTKALPIPTTSIAAADGQELKASIPEPKTIMHPARNSSLSMPAGAGRPPPSPGMFPGPNSRPDDAHAAHFLKVGLEELAVRRADLYMLSRSILNQNGKKRGWHDGWDLAPVIAETQGMEDIDLDDPTPRHASQSTGKNSIVGFENTLLKTALNNKDDFYRLYEILTDKALRHFTVASHRHSVQGNVADLAVLKYHLGDFTAAADYFHQTTLFFGTSGWTLLELSMLIMWSSSLKELKRKDDYVKVGLELLTKAAAAEKERKDRRKALRIGHQENAQLPDQDAIRGFLPELLEIASQVQNVVRLPMMSFFDDVEVHGSPIYVPEQDSFSLELRLNSLLTDDFPLESAKIRIVGQIAGQPREIWLESKDPVTISPGIATVQLHSNSVIAGQYEIDQVRFVSGKLHLYHDRDPSATHNSNTTTILRQPHVTLFQRAGALNVELTAAKHIQLDKTNALDVELFSGWNDVVSCELRVRAATGGLRLLTSEATVVESDREMSIAPEGSVISLQSLPPSSSVKIRFPYTVEQDVHSVSMRVEVQYKTSKGSFLFAKTPNVPIGLALGVNVQDVFKHNALFSRFTVSTATSSPLRLFKSELQESEAFEPHFGVAPSNPLIIFPKQPASLLYKITRKANVTIGPKTQKIMYLKLFYSVVQDEIEVLLQASLQDVMRDTPFAQYSRLVTTNILAHLHSSLSTLDLERAALLQYLPTSLLSEIKWQKQFPGLGRARDGSDIAAGLASLITEWQTTHPRIAIHPTTSEPRSILIPVDIPSIAVVHTADIRIPPVPSLPGLDTTNPPTICVNQLLPATLHLKWTRIWDIGGADSEASTKEDLEFSFEVTAPTETWLLAGRRKGHFVIPAPDEKTGEGMTSTPDTEAEIPLLLVPLREGYLPFPAVEIREVESKENGGGDGGGQCETDYRNLGETVRAVADRRVVTVSLDASGPGGGPLVLESEGGVVRGRVVV